MAAERIDNYRDFWPFYLRQHRCKGTQQLHVLGTGVALIFIAALTLTGNLWYLALAVIAGYAFAWLSHATIERNRPATFTYPYWSLVSDFRLFILYMLGRLDGEYARFGIK